MADEPLFQMEFGTMAGEDEDVIVSLPAETGGAVITKAADSVVVKTGAAPAADAAVEDLKGQFAAMTQRATAAEQRASDATQRAQEATQRLQHAEGQVVSSQLDTVLSGLAAAEAEASSAEQAYIAAAEAGDFPAQARAQRAMAGAETRKQRLEEAKADLEDAAKTRPAPSERRDPPARRAEPVDPVERFTSGMSQRSAAWIRAHPDCVTDQKLNARMLAAHNLALADDVAVDSDEYFQRIEAGIKPGGKPAAPPPAADGRRPSSAAASPSGGGGALNGGTEVRLTRGEALSATDGTLVWNYDDPTGKNLFKKGDPIGLAEMARRKHHGKAAGLYDKSVSE